MVEAGVHAWRRLCSALARRASLGRLLMLQVLYASWTICSATSFTCLDEPRVMSKFLVKVEI